MCYDNTETALLDGLHVFEGWGRVKAARGRRGGGNATDLLHDTACVSSAAAAV